MFEKASSNRRVFLTQCSKLALAAGLVPSTVLARPSGLWEVSLSTVSFEQFAAQAGTVFRVRRDARSALTMVLLDATAAGESLSARRAEDAGNERFSLVFMGPTTVPLEQDTYMFEHPQIGRFSMFIVPLHSKSGEYRWYEAVFNRRPVMRARRAL